jgi:long-chain acyl-CoA synthetase
MPDTVYSTFAAAAARYPRRTALRHRVRGRYADVTFGELKAAVDAVATNLRRRGIGKGDAVAIMSGNRPEWATADLAALKLGAVVVPIYATLPAPAVKYILADSRAKLAFVENAALFSLVDCLRAECAGLEAVVLFDEAAVDAGEDFVAFNELRAPAEGDEAAEEAGSEDAATVVYTSGTTGEPKGVVLTHRNVTSNAAAIIERFRVTADDEFVSFLPLSHMFERTCGYYVMLFAGGSIAYAEDLTTVARDVAAVRPTVLIAVPRVIEKAYGQIVATVLSGSWLRKLLVVAATEDLNRYANLKYAGKRIPPGFRLKCALYNRFIASKFRKLVGGRLRFIASGGAPLDKKLAKGCYIMGYNVVEGYGLTETSPVVAVNELDDIHLGTVGKPLDGVEVVIGEDDEVLVRGPNVMKGYLNKPQETARAIDADGWFHTGDQGRFDAHGNLVITGRIKELIVTSYGKNVAPAAVEAHVAKSRYVDQVVVYGDRREYLAALVVPDRGPLESYARERNVPYDDYPALMAAAEVRELFARELAEATAALPSYEQIKSFALVPEPFTVENGLLTPTLKLRRAQIAERYADALDALYAARERTPR